MPLVAVYDDRIIEVSDIYKDDLNKEGEFKCFNCAGALRFRQCRNADTNFTEHFYHPNTTKDTHIECERLATKREMTPWHKTFSGFIQNENREVIRTKHVVDAYCREFNHGVEFQSSPIDADAVRSRDATTDLDWIFNVEGQYMRRVTIGNKIICEIPHSNWENAVKAVKNAVYLYTGCQDWIALDNRECYRVEIEGVLRNVWIGNPCTFEDVHRETCLLNTMTEEGVKHYNSIAAQVETVRIMYARCKKSMFLLDTIHRDYVQSCDLAKGDIVAIRSVAGSGKTTTLLNIARHHRDKKILYTAFNRALIEEINKKLIDEGIPNVKAVTIDKLLYDIFTVMTGHPPNVVTLSPQNVQDIIPWLRGKAFPIRKEAVNLYSGFCGQPDYPTVSRYSDNVLHVRKPLLEALWNATINNELITFEGLRKLSLNRRWFKDYVEGIYDMVMIDEIQDFDTMMLQMLLRDTTMPKIFVGDPKQSIYGWRGAINGFNYMPPGSLVVEFYSTFRVGDPACDIIRQRFSDCWMISKSKNETILSDDPEVLKDKSYTYLFRTWRYLLTAARKMKGIYIPEYDKKAMEIRRQHAVIRKGHSFDSDQYEDNLPNFLKELSEDDLETMLGEIEENRVPPSKCCYKLYTIHGYKGLEDDNVRIAPDIDTEDDLNLWYVALTRGRKLIVED